MLEFVGILGLVAMGAAIGGFLMGLAMYRGLQRHIAAGEITLDGVTYYITPTPTGGQNPNLVARFKDALNSGLLDGEIFQAMRRNQQRVGH